MMMLALAGCGEIDDGEKTNKNNAVWISSR
jgi:hypothetical protein